MSKLTLKQVLNHLDSLTLAQALWWYIENHSGLVPSIKLDVFFHLRERYRREEQS